MGSGSEHHVIFRDRAGFGMQDIDLDLAFLVEVLQFSDDRIDRTGHIGLQYQAKLLDVPFLGAFEKVFQREFILGLIGRGFSFAGFNDRAGFFFRGVHLEDIAG